MTEIQITRGLFDNANPENIELKSDEGINEEVVRQISKQKKEPKWMLNLRLQGLKEFLSIPMPVWGVDLSKLDLNKITYYLKPEGTSNTNNWNDVPEDIKNTFDKLGIPEAEKKALAGAGGQYESEVVYHNLKKQWEEKGVLFENMDDALKRFPQHLKKYFMKCIPIKDHKFTALHAAVWSGGSFIYIPKGVKVDIPIQAYFRMNAKGGGQFEHTLIIVDEGAELHYIEGCSAPIYNVNSLHAGCVEIFVKKNAKVRYSSVENWSKNTYNLNTKRAIVEENGIMEWVGGNLGSGATMLYPCSILKGNNAKATHLSIAYAGEGQHQDTGAKVYHIGKNTNSRIVSKSISKGNGKTTYRGLVKVTKGAKNTKCNVECDSLLLDKTSKTDTIPIIQSNEEEVSVGHEASIGKITDEQLFYLTSRGISEEEAMDLIVAGFIEPIIKQLPLEYAVEMNRLIQLEMTGSVG
jgi:Fe-S cluster assembly protein SufB